MVQINPEDPSKFQFRKLDDPNDSTLTSIYKRAFRYAAPDLFLWGPLAPAHDALFARSTLARIQLAAGVLILAHSFRRFPSSIGKFRRRFTRLCTFAGGLSFSVSAFREISYFYSPNENPLYVEIQLARELSLLDPANNGKINKGTYWFGPKNFMPMNNEQYWKMVYSMEVNTIMAEQYLESELLTKYKEILNKNFGKDSVIELKSDDLTARLDDIVKRDTHDQEFHHSLIDEDTTKLFPFFNDAQDVQSKKKTLIYWTRHNPFDALQVQEYKEYYSYMFPRMKPDSTNTQQKK